MSTEIHQKSSQQPESKRKSSDRGASLVEYALLLALIAVVCIVAIRVIGRKASAQFSSISTQL